MKKKTNTECYKFTLNTNDVNTPITFKRNEDVLIAGLKVSGFIDDVWGHKGGTQYSVIYYADDKRQSAWFYGRELELL